MTTSTSIHNHDTIKVIYENETVRLSFLDRGSENKILICFTDAGLELGHVGVAIAEAARRPEQFVHTARLLNCSTLYVTDKTVSWANHLDFKDIACRIDNLISAKQIIFLGVSMGGFNAIAATSFFDAQLCIAFCPQFSIHPDIMPKERRYNAFVKRIEAFQFPSLACSFNERCVYYTFNGSQGADRYHWERFPVLSNARHYVFPEIDHRVARELRRRDLLAPLIEACMKGEEPGNILSGKVSYFIHEIDTRTKQSSDIK